MRVTELQVDLAYRKLKSYVYYDKTDLRLRARLAAFECSKNFTERLEEVFEVANTESPVTDRRFQKWLENVSYRLVPKALKPGPQDRRESKEDAGRFITNVSGRTEIEKVNYFFDGPIELHLIAVLWILTEGRHLDKLLGPECCGSRLSEKLGESDDKTLELFKKYHEQYARWRDTGIRQAKDLLINGRRNVAILGLDIQEYFYRVSVEYDEVVAALDSYVQDDQEDVVNDHALLQAVLAIGRRYRSSISVMLAGTHPDIKDSIAGLPIGLCSSSVLANWCLQVFDAAVLKKTRPAYYGRYVDDMLLVVPVASDPALENGSPVEEMIEDLLVKPGILRNLEGGDYEVVVRPGLRLQRAKCILQYFDARHSIAGLEKFQKKLEENGSDFLLLPVDEADNSMEDVAYELLYEGSVNKFRSVKGVAENRYELAKHLARQSILHLLTDDPPDRKISRGLQKFFKGRSAVEFFDLWERVLTLLAIAGDSATKTAFYKQLRTEISRIIVRPSELKKRLASDLQEHLSLSNAMAEAVCSEEVGFSELLGDVHSETIRRANLMRHHFVRRPLLNYTTYGGPLTARSPESQVTLDERKIEYSPRFVNFDECMLLAYSGDVPIKSDRPFEAASEIFLALNGTSIKGVDWSVHETEEDEVR